MARRRSLTSSWFTASAIAGVTIVCACQAPRGDAPVAGPTFMGPTGLVEFDPPARMGLRLLIDVQVVFTATGNPATVVHSSRRTDQIVTVRPLKVMTVFHNIQQASTAPNVPRPGVLYVADWSSQPPTLTSAAPGAPPERAIMPGFEPPLDAIVPPVPARVIRLRDSVPELTKAYAGEGGDLQLARVVLSTVTSETASFELEAAYSKSSPTRLAGVTRGTVALWRDGIVREWRQTNYGKDGQSLVLTVETKRL